MDDEIIKIPKQIDKYNYAFAQICYNCGRAVACNVIYATKIEAPSQDNRITAYNNFVFLGLCPKCSYPAMAIARQIPDRPNMFVVDYVFPKRAIPETPPELPDDIKHLFDELKNAYTNRQMPITVVSMGRVMLELILKAISGKEKLPLIKLIKELADECIIPKTLYEVAENIRVLGNKSIHEAKDITPQDAEDIWEFINIFIQYVYILPKKVEALKNRHS